MRRFENEINAADLPPPPMFVKSPETPQIPGTTSYVPANSSNFPLNNPGGVSMPQMSQHNLVPNRVSGPPAFVTGQMPPMRPPMNTGMMPPPQMMPPMPLFRPPPTMPDFSKLLEGQAVYSSAPVLKKRKIEVETTPATTSADADSSATVNINSAASKEAIQRLKQEIANSVQNLPPVDPSKPMSSYSNPSAVNKTYQQGNNQQPGGKKKKLLRTAAGQKWEDPTLNEWDPSDYRIFCGDLGNEVTDDTLTRVFTKYASFQKARVVRDKNTNKSRGYGFVSMKDPNDFIRAIREMNGKYVGNRPIKLKKSNWRDRNVESVKKKTREKKRLGYKV